MIEPNITLLANMTETFDEAPMIISGTVNGTQPVSLTVSGNISAVVSQPAFTMLIQMEIVQTFCIVVITVLVLTMFLIQVTKKRGV